MLLSHISARGPAIMATTNPTSPSALDQTTLTTLSLLEARLLRVEHLLYGATAPPPPTATVDGSGAPSAVASLAQLERRFGALLGRIRVYAELLRVCTFCWFMPR